MESKTRTVLRSHIFELPYGGPFLDEVMQIVRLGMGPLCSPTNVNCNVSARLFLVT